MKKNPASLPYQNNRSGVVIISLALVLAALGISIGVYSLSDLTNSQRETTNNAQGVLALNCSESGVEIGLVCISEKIAAGEVGNIVTECTQAATVLDSSDPSSCSYSYTVVEVREDFTIPQIARDDTEIIRLASGNPWVALSWQPGNGENIMEVNILDPSGSGYVLEQKFYSCNYTGTETDPGLLTSANFNSGRCYISGNGIKTKDKAGIIQFTSRINSANDIAVDIQGTGHELQGYKINSVGTAGEALRNTDILYLLPSNARVFNNTLYADSITVN